jgi:hypothetical protein
MMRSKRAFLLLWCLAAGVLAFVALDFWQYRNAPLYKKLETRWHQDVAALEASGKLPPPWFEVGEIELFGGTPETKSLLKRIRIPVAAKKKDGSHKLEVLVVAWEEDGKRGALVQYNLVDKKSQNMIWELGRTLILSEDRSENPFQRLIQELRP